MGLFRLVARVGRWRRRATFVLEEWSPSSRKAGIQNPAYRSLAFCVAWRMKDENGEADAIRRLGISPLAALRRQGPRGGPRPAVRPRGLQQSRRPAGAQGAQQPRALDVLRGACRRVQQELELFRRPDRGGSGRRAAEEESGASAFRKSAHYGWAARATAAAAATRCARSMCWSWNPMPTSRRLRRLSAPRQGASSGSPQGRQGSGQAVPRDPGGL